MVREDRLWGIDFSLCPPGFDPSLTDVRSERMANRVTSTRFHATTRHSYGVPVVVTDRLVVASVTTTRICGKEPTSHSQS